MTKSPDIKKRIEHNRDAISKMLSGSTSLKRLNNFNWLRHELSYNEPRTLFYIATQKQMPYLDYNHMKNIGDVYDYIIEHHNEPITVDAIRDMHRMLCNGTNLAGGAYRTSDKTLEITVNGMRFHAPDAYDIATRMNQIVYQINNPKQAVLTRAINAHYELIMLQPFDDFNKRTARIVMNWILIKGGYRPIVFNNRGDKQNYKSAIAARANGDGREYARYMYDCMLRTQEKIIKVLGRSKIFQA